MEAALPPIVFLDIDDVLCRCDVVGGTHVLDLMRGNRSDPEAIYPHLFAEECREVLRQVHEALEGQVRYVISSTWRQFFHREQMQEIFRSTDLGFVADAMLHGDDWCTPTLERSDRLTEIVEWLRKHHKSGQPWAVLDDTLSGGERMAAAVDSRDMAWGQRIIMCEPSVGLARHHTATIVAALREPYDLLQDLAARAGDERTQGAQGAEPAHRSAGLASGDGSMSFDAG